MSLTNYFRTIPATGARFIIAILLFCCLTFSFSNSPAQTKVTRNVLIFVSDTQSPLPFERLYPTYINNERATQTVLSDILNEVNVECVVHAGDITGYGSSKKEWAPIIPFLDSLHDRHIPFIAAKGNHDYFFFSGTAMKLFAKYVPDSPGDYSVHRFGEIGIILLNSNFDNLNKTEIAAEETWYTSMLTQCGRDSTIRFLITVDHHPPYTNSAVVKGSQVIREFFLPQFFASEKSVLFVSGHAHRYEHFRKQGKDFVVIGGGGGVFQNENKKPPETDLYTGSDHGMFFHYVRCNVANDSLSFNIVRVFPGTNLTEIADSFTIAHRMPEK